MEFTKIRAPKCHAEPTDEWTEISRTRPIQARKLKLKIDPFSRPHKKIKLLRKHSQAYGPYEPPISGRSPYIWTSMSIVNQSKSYYWTSMSIISQSKTYYWTSMPIISQSKAYHWTSMSSGCLNLHFWVSELILLVVSGASGGRTAVAPVGRRRGDNNGDGSGDGGGVPTTLSIWSGPGTITPRNQISRSGGIPHFDYI